MSRNRQFETPHRITQRRHSIGELLVGACSLLGLVGLAQPAEPNEAETSRKESKVEEVFQELFLGEIVYPQDRGEIQFTTGFAWARRGEDDFRLPVILEYGITDRLQVVAEFPIDFLRGGEESPEDLKGVGNTELEAYWNFYNNPSTGMAYGLGFGLGFPTATTNVGEETWIYEPFFVAYQRLDPWHVNCSLGLEIKDPLSGNDETEVSGQIGLAAFRRWGRLVPLLEVGLEIEDDQVPVRLAPGLYWQTADRDLELGVSLPIGLSGDAAKLGVFLFMTLEFGRVEANA